MVAEEAIEARLNAVRNKLIDLRDFKESGSHTDIVIMLLMHMGIGEGDSMESLVRTPERIEMLDRMIDQHLAYLGRPRPITFQDVKDKMRVLWDRGGKESCRDIMRALGIRVFPDLKGKPELLEHANKLVEDKLKTAIADGAELGL